MERNFKLKNTKSSLLVGFSRIQLGKNLKEEEEPTFVKKNGDGFFSTLLKKIENQGLLDNFNMHYLRQHRNCMGMAFGASLTVVAGGSF